MQLPFPLCLALNKVMDTLIRGNLEAKQLLLDGTGGLIAVELQNPELSIRLSIVANGIEIVSNYEDRPDLTLRADLPALMELSKAGHDPILDGRVQAEGDLLLAGVLQQLIVVLTSDWEARLAPFVGDMLAHKIGAATRGFSAWAANTHVRNTEDIGEYLQEEKRILVTRSEWRELEQDTDTLREDLDRLSARARLVEI